MPHLWSLCWFWLCATFAAVFLPMSGFAQLQNLQAEQKEAVAEWQGLAKRFQLALNSGDVRGAVEIRTQVASVERRFLRILLAARPIEDMQVDAMRERLTQSLTWLAFQCEAGEDFAAAAALRDEAAKVINDRFGPEDWRTNDAQRARDNVAFLRSLTAEQRAKLRNAESLEIEADSHYEQEQVAIAMRKLERASVLRKELQGEKHPDYASNLDKQAEIYRSTGDYSRAEPLFHQCLEIRKSELGEKHPEYATSLTGLAYVCAFRADYTQAESLLRQSVKIRRAVFGEEHPAFAQNLDGLALIYLSQADYARAEPLLRQVLEIKAAALGDKHPQYASTLSNLAMLYQAKADYIRAEPLMRQSLEITKSTLGEKHPQYAFGLANLAKLYCAQEDFARAEPLVRQSLDIRKLALGEEHQDYAIGLNHLAELYRLQADYRRAEPLFRQSLEITKSTLGENHPEYANSLNNLALLFLQQGDRVRAEPLYRQCLEIRRVALDEKHPDFADSLTCLAYIYMCQADYARAEPLLLQSLEIKLQHLSHTACVQSERQQLAMVRQARSCLDAYLSLASQKPKFAESAYAAMLRWKGSVWSRQREARVTVDSPHLSSTFRALQSISARLAKVALSRPDPQNLDAWRRQVDDLTRQREDVEQSLSSQSAAFRQAQQVIKPADIQARLPTDAVLVDFLEYRRYMPAPKEKMGQTVTPHLLAFILRPQSPLALVDLGPVAPLHSAVDNWRESYGEGTAATAAGQLLREKIWLPLNDKLSGAKLVLVSPDGVLGRFPLGALPGKEPGKYLLEDWALATVPVPQAIFSGAPKEEVITKDGLKDLCLLGDVDYNSADAEPPELRSLPRLIQRGATWKQFMALDGTAGEVAAIEKMYRSLFGVDGCTILAKAQASEERFTAEASRHRFLHVATHGFFATARKPVSKEPDHFLTFSSVANAQQPAIQDPGLLSGLALAGANRDPSDDRQDGILTASEVQSLDLRNVDLAVLSACETALGEAAGGEGVLGLQRAFQVAGTRATITSLWKVDDRGTQTLMTEFYKNLWEKKLSKGEALRQAQLSMLRNYDPKAGVLRGTVSKLNPVVAETKDERVSPFYWAAFLLSGDWR